MPTRERKFETHKKTFLARLYDSGVLLDAAHRPPRAGRGPRCVAHRRITAAGSLLLEQPGLRSPLLRHHRPWLRSLDAVQYLTGTVLATGNGAIVPGTSTLYAILKAGNAPLIAEITPTSFSTRDLPSNVVNFGLAPLPGGKLLALGTLQGDSQTDFFSVLDPSTGAMQTLVNLSRQWPVSGGGNLLMSQSGVAFT